MDKNRLIILNYQREIPPFLLNEIKSFLSCFNEIYYVSPKLYNDNRSLLSKNKSLHFVIGKKIDEFVSFLLLPFLFFTPLSLRNFFKAFKIKKFSFKFIKHHLIQIYEMRTLIYLFRKAIGKNKRGIIMSSWFNACALTSAFLQKKYTGVLSFSYAHAFEVQPKINPFLGCDFDYFKLRYNSKIVFISNKVRTSYLEYINKYISLSTFKKKIIVKYLGTFEPSTKPNLNDFAFSKPYRLVSCSSVVPIKRLFLIVDILARCEAVVNWIHIGGGPLMDELKSYANKMLCNKHNITFSFLGSLSNSEVFHFYENNVIDLFINTSESEGLPVSIMEAISFGIPIIATNVGGVSEIVDDSNGILIPKDFDPRYVALEIDKLLSDVQTRQLMRKNSIDIWNKNFNLEKNNRAFVQFIMEDYYEKKQ